MIKVSAGLSRKIGGANYSSKGGSVHLEQELDAGVIHDPARLRDGIRELFTLARQALEQELEGGPEKPQPATQLVPELAADGTRRRAPGRDDGREGGAPAGGAPARDFAEDLVAVVESGQVGRRCGIGHATAP